MLAVMAGSLMLRAARRLPLSPSRSQRPSDCASLFTLAFVWLVNQIVGFTFFHFPLELHTVLFGLAIGVAPYSRFRSAARDYDV
jgi:hypothetical protein